VVRVRASERHSDWQLQDTVWPGLWRSLCIHIRLCMPNLCCEELSPPTRPPTLHTPLAAGVWAKCELPVTR
jgi:hypothetical protein